MSNVAKLQREKLVCTKLIFQEKYKTRKGSHVKKIQKYLNKQWKLFTYYRQVKLEDVCKIANVRIKWVTLFNRMCQLKQFIAEKRIAAAQKIEKCHKLCQSGFLWNVKIRENCMVCRTKESWKKMSKQFFIRDFVGMPVTQKEANILSKPVEIVVRIVRKLRKVRKESFFTKNLNDFSKKITNLT